MVYTLMIIVFPDAVKSLEGGGESSYQRGILHGIQSDGGTGQV